MPKIHPLECEKEDNVSEQESKDSHDTEPIRDKLASDVTMTTNPLDDKREEEERAETGQSLKDFASALLAPAVYVEPRSQKEVTSQVSKKPNIERIKTELKMNAIKALKTPKDTPKFETAPLGPISNAGSKTAHKKSLGILF